ncbi:putative lipid II flippase FtsW [Arthrobacter agilis]|uniref:putative lipid II flippase FtsW n=1 Tax=Arthrobacter agilis TaxID=37921 RepID=UPI000B35BDB4|nr:putative lipid II flippase FtsW [Arthrobacter agilis]OUM45391.1 putative lipid II flippase FtsW [Arthrobacter agilis]PPB46981.1 putative lipid II flippase FtsW [Arthrobacter agilis]TPV23424.1 putative lipid II flippase FtsW [Arthrobacter agilis]VDR31806.1 Cell division protein FtsW [Arthrobacter agilis]
MVTTPTRPGGRKPPAGPGRDGDAGRPAAPAGAGSTPGRRFAAALGRTRHPKGTIGAPEQAAEGPGKGLRHRLRRGWELLEGTDHAPSGSSYYLILGSALALTAIGLLMVLSASSVEAISDGKDSFDLFLKQALWAAAGIFLMVVLSRLGPRAYRALAWPSLLIAVVLLVLVLVIGVEINGNKNWIRIGSQTFQPSEPTKLALALWFAAVLDRKKALIRDWKHAMIPALPLGGLPIGLVLIGGDLGTGLVLMMIAGAALFFAGAPLKLFTLAGVAALAGSLLMVATSSNRGGRISAWLRLNCDDGADLCLQSDNGLFAMASGGWFGVGIGQSRQKWNWIPEAHNDFIFAIIGEEFGLVGTLVIVVLFGILAVATIRVALRYSDPFVRILMGAILVWLIGQAFVNIGMVTGLLPVIGVPLPFISYGGSALTFTLAAVGVLLSFARKSPHATLPPTPGSNPVGPRSGRDLASS